MTCPSFNLVAEVKASGPIRTSLFEREGSMWGRLKGPSPRHPDMVEACRADDSDVCREILANGWLSEEQLHRAAERYRLGKSRSGKTIFWLIDECGIVRDGHIGSSWVSLMLQRRYPDLAGYIHPEHCLFGLHLSATDQCSSVKSVAITESERAAVILSELYPNYLWMAVASPIGFTIDWLAPLKGRRIILFPNTDETMSNFVAWLELADQARSLYHLDISVSHILEDHTTLEQKQQKIDLVDFLFCH